MRSVGVVAIVCGGLLAGCGSPPAPLPTGPTGTSPTPSLGIAVANAAFSTVVPSGWTDALSDPAQVRKFSATGEVEYLAEQQPPGAVNAGVNDVVANINVVLLATPVPDDQVLLFLGSLSTADASNISAPKPFTIGGSTGQYITYDREIAGTPGESREMVVNHGGSTFDIVLTTSQYAFQGQLPALQDVLTAWRWLS
ncbi:MAG: hypothetical protein M3R48_01985 [Candidatus Dormibacteraeota bacterium]|nr:hypothetical protein [Candidatus Dormibacteraeota bacterium]